VSDFDTKLPSTRVLCDILENMRKCYETRNFSHLMGLIEEAQYWADRMESALEAAGDLVYLETQRLRAKSEIRDLNKQRSSLKLEVQKLELEKRELESETADPASP